MIEHICKSCGRTYRRYNSLQRKCGLCYINDKQPKPRKPMKRIGTITRRLIDQRNEYIENNPPDKDGMYICYYCKQPVHVDYFNVEHKKSKTRHPKLRFVMSNLVPACQMDNERKGSMDSEEYIEKYYPNWY